jgi:hypothetical protein
MSRGNAVVSMPSKILPLIFHEESDIVELVWLFVGCGVVV